MQQDHFEMKQYFTATIISCLLLSPILSANTLQQADDFSELAQDMQQNGKPLVLAFDAEHCHYCARLQADHLDPMIGSEDYQHVLIRSLEFDGDHEITDFDGQTIEASEFSERYKVRLTPTLLFLNAEGKEIAKRILGYNTPEFYGAYLDRAIDQAVAKMTHDTQPTEEAAEAINTINSTVE